MDIKSALFYVEIVVGFFLFIFVAYFLLKALGVILMVVLAGIGFVAKVIFKILYFLFMIALTVCGAGYAMYTGLLFLNHEPVHILWTLSGVFVMLLGMNGLLKFIKNGFRFPSEIPSTYTRSNPSISSISSANGNFYDREDQDFHKEFLDEHWAKEDAWRAEQAQKDKVREEEYQEQKERDRANYEADQAKWAEFDRKREEDDEYNRRAREG